MSQTANLKISPSAGVNAPKFSGPTIEVVVPLYEGVTLLDVAGPTEALHQAGIEAGASDEAPAYRVHYAVFGPRDWVVSSTGLPIKGVHPDALPKRIHTLLIPGAPEAALAAAVTNAEHMRCLGSLAKRAKRLASVCTGAFFLGELGALDGRRATTHWAGVAALTQRYPLAKVAQDRLYESDGPVWTSAGVLSGVDMALALIEHDIGREVAISTARRLVVFLVRHGGQSQFSAPISLQARSSSERMSALVAFLQSNLSQQCSVADMAAAAAMSERTLHRRCRESFGLTPAQLLAELRLEHARELLLSADRSIKAVAAAAGYATASALTKAFTERFGVAPTRYREHFA